MRIEQRSYTNGVYFRPKPVISERGESHLLAIATPWGPLESAQKSAQMVTEQFELLAKEDVTTPFESIPTLSAAANRLRIGALMANQFLYRNENGKIWKAAVELSALHYDHQVLSWVQVGCPHLLLLEGKTFHPLAYEPDWAHQTGNAGPLFTQALGIENNVPLKAGSLRVRPHSQLLLVSRGTLPRSLFALDRFSIEQVGQLLIDEDEKTPFWVGLVTLDDEEAA